MIPVIRRAVPYDNEVEWKYIYIPHTRSAERLAVPKSKGNPVIKRIGSSQIIMGSCIAMFVSQIQVSTRTAGQLTYRPQVGWEQLNLSLNLAQLVQPVQPAQPAQPVQPVQLHRPRARACGAHAASYGAEGASDRNRGGRRARRSRPGTIPCRARAGQRAGHSSHDQGQDGLANWQRDRHSQGKGSRTSLLSAALLKSRPPMPHRRPLTYRPSRRGAAADPLVPWAAPAQQPVWREPASWRFRAPTR